MTHPPRILAIAGSDSSGGAGIQADIKTITMLGGYAMTAITAVTAQDTTGVHAVEVLSAEMVAAQIDACVNDIGVDAVKIGMLGSAAIAHAVADLLEGINVPVVFDPVMVATSGDILSDGATINAFGRLMALANLTTPNVPELEALSGHAIEADDFSLREAAEAAMRKFSIKALLAKGGHFSGGTLIHQPEHGKSQSFPTDDLLFDCLYKLSSEGFWEEWEFPHPRIATRHTHGTGCTLASAIATELGRGAEIADAVRTSVDFVHRAIGAAPGFGAGHGPMGHQAFRLD